MHISCRNSIVSGIHQEVSPMSCAVHLYLSGSTELLDSLISGNDEKFLHEFLLVFHFNWLEL